MSLLFLRGESFVLTRMEPNLVVGAKARGEGDLENQKLLSLNFTQMRKFTRPWQNT